MRARQYNAYNLEYTLHKPKDSNMPILPDTYVQIVDNSGKNRGIMWVSDCKLEYSKQKGLIQHIKLKIPNTYHLPEAAPELAAQNASNTPAYVAPNFGLPQKLIANMATSIVTNYQDQILSHIQKQQQELRVGAIEQQQDFLDHQRGNI
jgi:hypothetical protein